MPPEEEWTHSSRAVWSDGVIEDEFEITSCRYQSGGELGRGGMGVVTSTYDQWLEREVAVKRPRGGMSETAVLMMNREARITARLLHPSIVPLYDVGEDEQGQFYTMPVLVGKTLAEENASSLVHLVRALSLVAAALAYAHSKGFVHRDVKPSNILLGSNAEVWLLDWGVAFDPKKPDHSMVGTKGYRAPEQKKGECSTASDVYGLGRVFENNEWVKGCEDAELLAIVERCVQVHPAERYDNAGELVVDLNAWIDGRRVSAYQYTLSEVFLSWARTHKALLAVMGASLLMIVSVAGWAYSVQQEERSKADHAFAITLAQQASVRRNQADRPAAELLAAETLRLEPNNTRARGVWMQWAGNPRTITKTYPLPCERPNLTKDGKLLCFGETIRQYSVEGELLDERPVPKKFQVLRPRRVELHEEFSLLENPNLEIILLPKDGSNSQVFAGQHAVHGEPGVLYRNKVSPISLAGSHGRASDLCPDRAYFAHYDGENFLIGCRGAFFRFGTVEEMGPVMVASDFPSAAVQMGDFYVLGGFKGHVMVVNEEGEQSSIQAEIGGVSELLALDDERVIVTGERGLSRVVNVKYNQLGVLLPGRHLIVGGADPLVSIQSRSGSLDRPADQPQDGASERQLKTYEIPVDSSLRSYDFRDRGGISLLNRQGDTLIVGHSTGEIDFIDLKTGAEEVVMKSGSSSPKGGVFLSANLVYFQIGGGGKIYNRTTKTVSDTAYGYSRGILSTERGAIRINHDSVGLIKPSGGYQLLYQGVANFVTELDGVFWMAGANGTVFREGEDSKFEPVFQSDVVLTSLEIHNNTVFGIAGGNLQAWTLEGEPKWTFRGTSRLRTMDISDRYVAVGSVYGEVYVLNHDGKLLADLGAHKRLVSKILIDGDELISASWDGMVYRYRLDELETPVEELLQMASNWGLSLEEALED